MSRQRKRWVTKASFSSYTQFSASEVAGEGAWWGGADLGGGGGGIQFSAVKVARVGGLLTGCEWHKKLG